MEKAKLVLLSITVFFTLCTKGPVRPDNGDTTTGPGEGLCIYATKVGITSDLTYQAFNADTFPLIGEPIIAYDDIVTYDTINHIMELAYPRDSLKIENINGTSVLYGIPFIITLDSANMYGGWFWTSMSSIPCHWVVIEPDDLFDSLFANEIRIKFGYPNQDHARGEDPRNNSQIFERLVKDGKATGNGMRFKHGMLTNAENKKMTDLLNAIPAETITEFNNKYQAWKNTWVNYQFCSNPRCFTEPEEYESLLNYCKSKGRDIWALVFKTHFEFEREWLTALLIEDLTWNDYGCLAGKIHEAIRADADKEWTSFWTYYIQEILNNDTAPCSCPYIFTVTDTCQRPLDIGHPSDTLSAGNYAPDSSGRSYCVRFSAGQDTVVINGDLFTGIDSVTGVIDSTTLEYRAYYIETMTGGRFIWWMNSDPMRAEYTLYGSGLPVIWSERGVIKKAY
jgi:hypothetical protein